MHRLVTWIETTVLPALGPFGVFVVAFLDSSFLSLPQVNDLLVVAAAVGSPAAAPLVVAAATLGSVAGCLALAEVGRRGGEARLARLSPERLARMRGSLARFDALAVAVAALLPPPTPFKLFVLAAGVAGMPRRRLALTVFLARGLRFTAGAALAAAWGPDALQLLRAFGSRFAGHAGALGVTATVALVLVVGWRRRRWSTR